MVGPVFSLELLLGSRRGRLSTWCRLLAAGMIVQFVALFAVYGLPKEDRAVPDVAGFLYAAFPLFVSEYFLLLFLVTPAFVAGAVADEKARGTLLLLLTADLTSWEIVAGKLLGRLAQVGSLALVAWPVFCFLAGYGQFGWQPLLAFGALTVLVLFALGAASIWTSVRSRQTRDAVVRVYLGFSLVFLGVWGYLGWGLPYLLVEVKVGPALATPLLEFAAVLRCLNPVHVLEPLWGEHSPAEFARRLRVMALVLGGFGLVCLGLSVWWLRAAATQQLEGTGQKRRHLSDRPPPDDDPVRWKEKLIGRPLPRWLGIATIFLLTTASSYAITLAAVPVWFTSREAWTAVLFAFQGAVAAVLLSFVAGIRASGSVSAEREQQTWDSLLLTPLDTWDLLVDKVIGTMATFTPFLLAHALPAAVLALTDGVLAFALTMCMLVLTWSGAYYMSATGLCCSVRATSSWRSLVATLGTGYGYWLVAMMVFGFVYLALGCTVIPLLFLFLSLMGLKDLTLAAMLAMSVTTALGGALVLWRAANARIAAARAWVDQHERYGRTITRSLTRALRKHQQLEAKKREKAAATA